MNPLRERVLDAIPGYRQAQARHDRLIALTQIVPTVHEALDAGYIEQIAAAADNESASLDDLAASYALDRQTWAAKVEFQKLVIATREQARTAAESAKVYGATEALDFLRDELDTLMAEVDKHRAPVAAHPNTAEEAIRGGGTKQWELVEGLIARYAELRAEHRKYVTLQSGEVARGFAVCGQIARFLEADPYWRYRRATCPGHASTDPSIATWFTQSGTGEAHRTNIWPLGIPRNQWLLTVADNQPWLPDADTIIQAHYLAEELFAGAKSYRTMPEIGGFQRRISELNDLGVTTTITSATADH